MTKNLPADSLRDAEKRLTWPLRLTRVGMLSEALLRAFWPLGVLMLSAGALLMAGLLATLPPYGAYGLLAALALAGLGTLVWGLRCLKLPGRLAAEARLDATLPGQPIAALADVQASGADDAASRAIWQAHRIRMVARLENVRATPPDLSLAARDPYALRYTALLAFIMALAFGGLFRATGLSDFLPTGPAKAAATTSWEGWVEPPAYTGKPSLYLNDQPEGGLILPKGSHMIIRFYGKIGDLTLSETVSGSSTDTATPQPGYSFEVTQSGTLEIDGPNGAIWQISALADTPPSIRSEGGLTRNISGDLKQSFFASDDYGVTAGQARIKLDLAAVTRRFGLLPDPEPLSAIMADLPLPFRGGRTEISGVFSDNFAQHPWAGLPVLLSFTASDDAGQEGRSAPLSITLPGRRFFDPLAMALIEQRRDLLWSRENAPRVARLLRATSNRPDGFFSREISYLKIRVLVRRLEASMQFDLSGEARDEISQGLWDIAVVIEDGNLEDARDRLRRAEERLAEAMRQGASAEELAELMDELRQALRDYAQQLAQQPQEGDSQSADNQQGQEITQDDLEAMMDAIEEAMREGRHEEAQAMLDALRELMENMRVTEGGPGEAGERPGDSPGEQAMQGLADSLNQQQGLSDEAFRDFQEQENPSAQAGEGEGDGRQEGEGQSGGQRGGPGDGPQGDLAERQQHLADEIGRQRRNLPGAGSEGGEAARDALDEAGRAMEGAANELAEGDLSGALDRQAEAMEALREGMRQLDSAMAEAERNQQGQQGANAGQPGSTRPNDPLGRGPASHGGAATDEPLAGGADVNRRAQELMQDIRRRSGETERPEAERNYLRRLLDRF